MFFVIENLVLAPSYSPFSSTIATTRLNCRVRNENGCDPRVKAPKPNFQFSMYSIVKVKRSWLHTM